MSGSGMGWGHHLFSPLWRNLRPARLRPQKSIGWCRTGDGLGVADGRQRGPRGPVLDSMAGADALHAYLHRSGFQTAGGRISESRHCHFHGRARFAGRTSVEVGSDTLEALHIVIAAGAKPATLNIPGEDLLTTSDQFLDLEELPPSLIFVGGGYISFEFAHLAARAG